MIGLYIHIPFCVSKCKYCDFNSFEINNTNKAQYIKNLIKEIEMYSNENKEEIESIFLGGGTPSILTSEEIIEIFRAIYDKFKISKDAEITMECNPGTLDRYKLESMKKIGVNRLSIGLQAIQEKHLKYIGRIHDYETFEKNYLEARNVGFDNINIDLMYNLPNQTLLEWKESLEKIVKLNPEHISAYSLILEEGTQLNDMYDRKEFELMEENEDIELYNYTINYLNDNGYKQYEISNYSKEGYECKHNIIYWNCDHYIGVGAGASGYIRDIRYNNENELNKYNEKIESNEKPIYTYEELTIKDKLQEKIFMGLRMNKGINLSDINKKFSIDFYEIYQEQLKKLQERQLIIIENDILKLTQRGREISNSVFIEFLD